MSDGWPRVALRALATLEYGAALPAAVRKGDRYPVFGSNGEIGRNDGALVRGPGIIIGRKGTVGAVTWSSDDFWPIDTAYFVEPVRPLDLRWLYWTLSVLPLANLDSSTGVPGLNRQDAYELTVPFPDSAEQRRIADVLDCIDLQIRLTRDRLRKLDLVGNGLISSLLFVDTDCPNEWTHASLDDVTAVPITYGIVQAGSHVPDGVPYVRTGDMSGDELVVDQMLRTSPRIAASYGRSTVRTGDLVCAIRATVGKVLPVPQELDGGNLTQGTARVAPGRAVDPRFLLWEMRGGRVQRQIALAVKGTTFMEITLAALRQVRIAYPPLEAQRAIASTLDAHDALVRREKEYLKTLRELQAGLAADLLSGRVRVPAEVPA